MKHDAAIVDLTDGPGTGPSAVARSDAASDRSATLSPESQPEEQPKSEEADDAAPAAPRDLKKLRFRASCVAPLGAFYPDATVHVHKMGYADPNGNLQSKASNFYGIHHIVDPAATFRITMVSCDAPAETLVGWHRDEYSAEAFTADEFCDILKLGEAGLGELMMFTICEKEARAWVVARQIRGKHYTLQDCMDILRIPLEARTGIEVFGPQGWKYGTFIPRVWIAKDLPIDKVVNKIRIVMQEGSEVVTRLR